MQDIKKVSWRSYTFSSNDNRTFNCNSIIFVNAGDKSLVTINDSFDLKDSTATVLSSLNAVQLNSNENELDTTSYKITFTPTNAAFVHKLLVWVKTYEGIQTKDNIRLDEMELPDRREEMKQLQDNRERKM